MHLKHSCIDPHYPKILGSESFARWLVSLALAPVLALVLVLVLELELALALDIERYRITASVSHLTCLLPPHQSVIWLFPCHHISQSFDLPTATTSSVRASASTRDRASASARHRALPYHCISQSFDLPPATTSVSHLTCPLPPHHQSELVLVLALEIELVLALDIEHYHITTSVNHLTCPLPPHQSVIWLAHCHHISQSFDLPTATTSSVRASTSTRDRASASTRHRALLYHCISQSFDLTPATISVSHLTCPLPPHHQSELALALALEIELALALDIEHYRITTSVSHLTCPLPPHQSVIWLAHCHHIISQSWC